MEWTRMAVVLGCGTPQGQGPPILRALILWEKGLF